MSAEQALSAIGNASNPHNWLLLEPMGLQVHRTGCGGLDEMRQWLPDDSVMFGVLRFYFPRESSAPPIVKYLFVHWIGSKVSVVRRGQWNSKLEKAALKIRSACDFAFRKTAYALEDLQLVDVIEELRRVTCITSSDTRQLSVEWYSEGLQIATEESTAQKYVARSQNSTCTDQSPDDELQLSTKPFLRDSAQHAIKLVREDGRQWKWVLLTVVECRVPSSGGA
jgi:hypothetical protein